MIKLKHLFKNKGFEKYNDDVFDHEPFDLTNNTFHFLLRPIKSRYWRFGLVLSKSRNFKFDPQEIERYNDENLKFVEINVGELQDNDEWGYPNRIAIGSYHIPGYEGFPKRSESYTSGDIVQVKIKLDSISNLLFEYNTNTLRDQESFPIDNYRYFRIFSWADKISFEIDCEISIISTRSFLINNITFRLGDMFDEEVIEQSDILFLPASTAGTASSNILQRAAELNIPRPPSNSIGAVLLYTLQTNFRLQRAGYAYSVNNNSSDENII
ncbi:MAG: hypothetical protein ACTHJN_13420, partial [Ginsengibacter sp.]